MDDAALIETLRSKVSGALTASNMLYWMTAVRLMYLLVGFCLQKWSPTYHRSEKKLNLINYWLQLFVYTPSLGLFLWVIVVIHGDDFDLVKTGLIVFAHLAMILLAMYSMEMYLRGHLMDKVLLLHHVLLIVITLYVIDSEDPSIDDPIDLIDFGIIEGLGAMTEQPTLVGMLFYRYYSDSTPEQKDPIRPKVLRALRLSLLSFAILKIGLVVASFAWYGIRFDDISNSNLVWIVPVLRVIHTPTLLWSFYVQWLLYKRVATAPSVGATEPRTNNDPSQTNRKDISDRCEEGACCDDEVSVTFSC